MTDVRSAADAAVAAAAVRRFALLGAPTCELLQLSENATYRVGADGFRGVLRVHRTDYHPAAGIVSELQWLAALRAVPELDVIEPYATPDGELLIRVPTAAGERHAVMFAEIDGSPPDEATLGPAHLRLLGQIAARLHAHVHSWSLPAGFTRFAWDYSSTIGVRPRWGDWRAGIGVRARHREQLEPAAELVRRRLADYGAGADRFGLIHADLRLANVLETATGYSVIDFDDAGFGWYLYDFAAAISFLETSPRIGEWASGWLEGYREVRPTPPEAELMLPTFVMLRRLMLLAWMGSHPHADEARTLGDRYADDTVTLAQRYVISEGERLW